MPFIFRWGIPGRAKGAGFIFGAFLVRTKGAGFIFETFPVREAKGAGFISVAKGAGFISVAFPVREILPGYPCDAQSGRQNYLCLSVGSVSPHCELM